MMRLLFDVSRLLQRAGRKVLSGVDRVELAYACHLIEAWPPEAVLFGAAMPGGRFGLLPRRLTRRFLLTLSRRWERGETGRGGQGRLWLLRLWSLLGQWREVEAAAGGTLVYLLVSHQNLERRNLIEAVKVRCGGRAVFLIHDLLPLQYPEYFKPHDEAIHQRRMATVMALADGLIFNSSDTKAGFSQLVAGAQPMPPSVVAWLGAGQDGRGGRVSGPPALTPPAAAAPYFVMLGTIEPRKNHLMLLKLWRRLVQEQGAAAPRLVIIGRRGWENEQVVDMLTRCRLLRGAVEEHHGLSDQRVAALLGECRALLLPSFAEGFGLPVIEALSRGVPVICSALSVFREIAGDVPTFVDPLDGPGWERAILDYAQPDSPGRRAQCARMSDWQAPNWSDHFALADRFIRQIAGEG